MSRQSCNSLQHSGHGAPLTLVTRRGALKVSLGTALGAVLGPTLPSAFAGSGASESPAPKSVILLWLEGGPCQQDSFDPKESKDKKLGYRFPPIATSSPDLRLASCMPRLARQGNELAVVRTMFSPEIDHAPAQYYMQTGWRNTRGWRDPARWPAAAQRVRKERAKRVRRSAREREASALVSSFACDRGDQRVARARCGGTRGPGPRGRPSAGSAGHVVPVLQTEPRGRAPGRGGRTG